MDRTPCQPYPASVVVVIFVLSNASNVLNTCCVSFGIVVSLVGMYPSLANRYPVFWSGLRVKSIKFFFNSPSKFWNTQSTSFLLGVMSVLLVIMISFSLLFVPEKLIALFNKLSSRLKRSCVVILMFWDKTSAWISGSISSRQT